MEHQQEPPRHSLNKQHKSYMGGRGCCETLVDIVVHPGLLYEVVGMMSLKHQNKPDATNICRFKGNKALIRCLLVYAARLKVIDSVVPCYLSVYLSIWPLASAVVGMSLFISFFRPKPKFLCQPLL